MNALLILRHLARRGGLPAGPHVGITVNSLALAFVVVVATNVSVFVLDKWDEVEVLRAKAARSYENPPKLPGLPAVALDISGVEPSPQFSKDYKFTTDWLTRLVETWQVALAPFKGKPDVQYLEIGVFEPARDVSQDSDQPRSRRNVPKATKTAVRPT